jgi:branched-chain amino acid transport system substrate-binding protein
MHEYKRGFAGSLAWALVLVMLSTLLGGGYQAKAATDAGETNGVTSDQVLIGSCSPLSGSISELGRQTVVGGKIYLDYINDQGGVHGRKIKLISYDDCYEPPKAIECFAKIYNTDKVFAGAFFCGSPTAAKYVPLAEDHNFPIVGLLTGADLIYGQLRPHIISIRLAYREEAKIIVDHLWDDLHMHKIAVLFQNDAFGVSMRNGVEDAVKAHGGTLCATGSFIRNVENVDKALKEIKQSNPDAVVAAAVYGGLSAFVRSAHADNWHPLICAGSYVNTEEFVKRAGKDAEGVVFTQAVPPASQDNLPTVALYKKCLKKYAPAEKPNFTSLEGFVDGMVLVEGLKRAGADLTRTKLIKAIESIHNFDTGLGPAFKINYSATRHKGFDNVCYTIVKGGQSVLFTDWRQIKPH